MTKAHVASLVEMLESYKCNKIPSEVIKHSSNAQKQSHFSIRGTSVRNPLAKNLCNCLFL